MIIVVNLLLVKHNICHSNSGILCTVIVFVTMMFPLCCELLNRSDVNLCLLYTDDCFVYSMYFVKRGSSDSNLPKIDATVASVFQPHHAVVCTSYRKSTCSVYFTSLSFVAIC